MNTIPRTSGIYKWTCTPTKKIYIGSAANLYSRMINHRTALRNNRHVNSHFQNAWNKYGEEAFEFEVIELILASFLLEREQYYLDKLMPFVHSNGFNIYPKAGSAYGYRVSDESLRRMSESQKKRMANMTPEQRSAPYVNRKRSVGVDKMPIGRRKSPSSETRSKISEALSGRDVARQLTRVYVFVDPKGNEVVVINLARFCRENDLTESCMRAVAGGAKKHYKRWCCKSTD